MRCCRRQASQQLTSEREERGTVSAGEITEVADADEASGQYMLAESAQELDRGECHDALLVAVRVVFPSEAHAVTVEDEQALVADGDAVCIAAEIAQHASGLTKGRLGIDHPVVAVQAADQFRELRRIGQSRGWAGAV